VILEFPKPKLTWTAVEPARADISKLWICVRCSCAPSTMLRSTLQVWQFKAFVQSLTNAVKEIKLARKVMKYVLC